MGEETKYLLVVGGPTASGKTSLAIALARHFSTEIISADSRQFYREMRIGNARPEEEELAAVPHHFVADRALTEPLSAGEFARAANTLLVELFKNHDHVVLVGGSGLFIRALTEGLDEFPEVDPAVRQRVRDLYETEGLVALQNAVEAADPDYYAEVDRQNPARLQRALEVCWSSGRPYSSFRSGSASPKGYVPVYFQPVWPREQLYARINLRVEQMIAAGLEAEARSLATHKDLPALQTVGYQEWWPYFAGEATYAEVIAAIQQNSRRYAKRQMTWNRRDGYWKSVPEGEIKIALAYLHLLKEEGLRLQTSDDDSSTHVIHPREQRKRLALVNLEGAVQGSTQIIFRKDWAFLKMSRLRDLSHLAQVTLMHEACYRAGREVVYTVLDKNDDTKTVLQTLEWQMAVGQKLPKDLREMEGEIWCWRG